MIIWELTDRSFAVKDKWSSYIKASDVGSDLLRIYLAPRVYREVWANSQEMKAEVPASWPGAGPKFLQVSKSIPKHVPYL